MSLTVPRGGERVGDSLPMMEVDASEAATAYIRSRGFKVWIWAKPVGGRGGAAFLEATTEMPSGYEFELVRFPNFELFVERGLELGERIEIVMRRRLPPRRLEVRWRSRTGE